MIDVALELARLGLRAVADLDRVAARDGEDRNVHALAEHLQLLDGARALHVGGDQQGLPALLEQERASLPVVVVLPEPWRPTIMMPVSAGLGANSSGSPVGLHQLDQLVLADLDEAARSGRP